MSESATGSTSSTRMDLSVQQVAEQLQIRLQQYLEAQYHVRDEALIAERQAMLREPGVIGQTPYLETTPSYKLGPRYSELELSGDIGIVLEDMSSWEPSIGIYERPYVHQAAALESFLTHSNDIVVATGTGSGKTETFLLPILGNLLSESARSRESFGRPAIRALLLYPMNALVSDQLSRLRRLFGDGRLAGYMVGRGGRPIRFGMYTSRTPYPGERTGTKDGSRIRPLLEYYVGLQNQKVEPGQVDLVGELKMRGRWPAKDLTRFLGTSGEKWERRLITQPGDRELLTRHEMQRWAPDVLVTNYSMLEYMMLRPIERSLFDSTRAWLASDPQNVFVLVLDEAHMYRGAGGAEVAFLIRRLRARLGIGRERMRCILTSASLGKTEQGRTATKRFAIALVGERADRESFDLIVGVPETRPPAHPGTPDQSLAYAEFDLEAFLNRAGDLDGAISAVGRLASRLAWPPPPAVGEAADDGESLRHYLYERLHGEGVAEELIERTRTEPTTFEQLAKQLFPGVTPEQAQHATGCLLALGTYAHDGSRSLFPTRAHLLFRGLPGMFACVNPKCSARRFDPNEALLLGRLFTEPQEHCECGARVYELYTHRDCGAAFLRVFGRGRDSNFYWHERGGELLHHSQPLTETWLLLEDPHHDKVQDIQPIWLDVATGRVSVDPPSDTAGWRHAYRPRALDEDGEAGRPQRTQLGAEEPPPFRECPACTRRTGHKIMDLATKGEQPFANLVRSQFLLQPATKPADSQFPNAGRKVLLFSDGRQKAARLARDLPREVEFDTFREALVLASQRITDLGKETVLNERIYIAFLDVCQDFHLNFFDRERGSHAALREHIAQYTRFYESLEEALDDGEFRPDPPAQYSQALLRQLCDPYYSLSAACAAVVQPTRAAMRRLERGLGEISEELSHNLSDIVVAWLQALLERTAFDHRVSTESRRMVDAFHRPIPAGGRIPSIERVLSTATGIEAARIAELETSLANAFTQGHSTDPDAGRHIDPSTVALRIALDSDWWYCLDCGLSQFRPLLERCANCQSPRLEVRGPSHPYMVSRKGYFLEPLRRVLAGARPTHLTAEEHTAQLGHRDHGVVYATTEEHELAFQDVVLGDDKPPVDVLSCTTTMEVGIDIGSLTAVGLRNVPPQRENYQQRAGRSGRRGAAVSTVVTYAQDGPHDNYYYENPTEIIAGNPRDPRIKVDNRRLATRHIHAYLLQTFFHGQLGAMGAGEQQAAAVATPGLLSSWGAASAFFAGDSLFSFQRFATWVQEQVVEAGDELDAIVQWLPDDLIERKGASAESIRRDKATFATEASRSFLMQLESLGSQFARPESSGGGGSASAGPDAEDADADTDSGGLLDYLFDRGMLPSYAFPTDLCAFNIFEMAADQGRVRIKEKPQQGKTLALSEYAPGRLLVVNKETYRVGGIYEEGGGIAAPARRWFRQPLGTYVYCGYCTYVRTEPLQSPEERCPVCGEELAENEILDPPGFAPERGRAVGERDREQEISYATSAQFPIPLGSEDFSWVGVSGARLHFAHEENRRLIVVNKGPAERGFAVCEECGAAWPASEGQREEHWRPYLAPGHLLRREGLNNRCRGPMHASPLYLGYTFLTDLLIARIGLGPPLRYGPRDVWLHDALRSAAEALVQAASRLMDIDPDELDAGYRLLPPVDDESYLAAGDLYLFDTASGGAGYAAAAGERLGEVLAAAEQLAWSCPANCQRSCTKCLRHYGNRYWHNRLDRFLAGQLLAYARTGQAPAVEPLDKQATRLRPLRRYLELEGWSTTEFGEIGGSVVPLAVTPPGGGPRSLAIGTSPALTDREDGTYAHPLYALDNSDEVEVHIANDYVLSRDLPTAYQEVRSRI